MKVAILGDYPLDITQIRGGVQAAFVYLAKALSQIDGLRVHILTFGDPEPTESPEIQRNGVTLHLLPPLPHFERARNYRTYQAMLREKLARIRPDVVHAQDATAHAYVALRSGYPTVVTAHGIRREDGKYYGSFGRRMRNYFDSWLIERHIMRHTQHLIAIGHYVTDYFALQLRPDVQVYYVPNAIDESFFDLTDTSDGRTILYAGRVMPRKRVLDLVRAFAKLVRQMPAAQLRIAGEYHSEASYVETIRDFIQSAKLEGHVHWLGSLPEGAVLAEFARCDVLALPSIQETTPMVIAQAMAAGKPVVATPVGGVAEMVRQGETGFLTRVGDTDGLADTLLLLLRNPSLRMRLGQTGRKIAVENYRAEVVARRTFAVYQRMAATRV